MVFDGFLRTPVDVRRQEMPKGGRHIVHLQYQISGLQRGSGVIGEILTELSEPSQDRKADGEVFRKIRKTGIRHGDD